MLLTILGCGTSTGVPIPGCRCPVCLSPHPCNKRLRTSAVISTDEGRTILIDATPDLRQQALRAGIERIDAVLFTHAHADHILGIDDLRAFNFIQQSRITCYGSRHTLPRIRHMFSYVFEPDENYLGGALPQLDLVEFENGVPFKLFDLPIEPFSLMHGDLEVTGFRFGNLAYATDCNAIPLVSQKRLKGIDLLVLDGLRYEAHRTHFTIPEAISVAGALEVGATWLTHMTHTVEYEEVSRKLPRSISLAYDGLQIEFSVDTVDTLQSFMAEKEIC